MVLINRSHSIRRFCRLISSLCVGDSAYKVLFILSFIILLLPKVTLNKNVTKFYYKKSKSFNCFRNDHTPYFTAFMSLSGIIKSAIRWQCVSKLSELPMACVGVICANGAVDAAIGIRGASRALMSARRA